MNGVPVGLVQPRATAKRVVFDHIPKLRELIPNGGWPGVIYAQVCVQNVKLANDRDERPAHLTMITGSSYFTIRGPKGEAHMALLGSGSPIKGAAPESGERLFFTDGAVKRITGLEVKDAIWFRGEDDDESRSGRREVDVKTGVGVQGSQGDARVQGGQPAQRK